MRFGEWLIRATAMVALAGYLVGALATIASARFQRQPGARFAWTGGALVLLAHIICAFHFEHQWSHAHAAAETARQTREQIGIDSGGGIYFNYLFAAVWLGDAFWWLLSEETYRHRPRAVTIAVHAFLFFIVFNATVVFGTWPVRIVGIVICLVLIGGWFVKNPSRV